MAYLRMNSDDNEPDDPFDTPTVTPLRPSVVKHRENSVHVNDDNGEDDSNAVTSDFEDFDGE
jgi:hypothetical protein